MKSLLSKPAPTFDDPLEMLMACHDRIENQCATLLKLAQHVAGQGADAQAQQAAAGILRYFDTAGQHHHEDEENDLFPLLQQIAPLSERATVQKLIEGLLLDHEEMHRTWSALREKLLQIREGNMAHVTHNEADAFAHLYASHIAIEEGQLLPLAKRILSIEQVASLGRSMSRRRGAKVG